MSHANRLLLAYKKRPVQTHVIVCRLGNLVYVEEVTTVTAPMTKRFGVANWLPGFDPHV